MATQREMHTKHRGTTTPKPAKEAHPLDVPEFLKAKGRGPRDEAVCRAMAEKAAARTNGAQEQGNPRVLEAIKKGVIAASVLKDPKSQVIFLASQEKKSAEKTETREAKKAEKEAAKAAKPKFLTTVDIAAKLSEGKAERVRKSFIRTALDDADYPLRDGKRNYLPEEFEAIKKIVLEWKPKPKKEKVAKAVAPPAPAKVEEKAPIDNARKVAKAKGAAAMEIARLDAKIAAEVTKIKAKAKKGNKR